MIEEHQRPCPECGQLVDARAAHVEANYPSAMTLRATQVKLGPEHARGCEHWRKETPRE